MLGPRTPRRSSLSLIVLASALVAAVTVGHSLGLPAVISAAFAAVLVAALGARAVPVAPAADAAPEPLRRTG